jgi:hypothetical protein
LALCGIAATVRRDYRPLARKVDENVSRETLFTRPPLSVQDQIQRDVIDFRAFEVLFRDKSLENKAFFAISDARTS